MERGTLPNNTDESLLRKIALKFLDMNILVLILHS